MMWKTCTTLSNTQLEDLCAGIGCKQSKSNSGPIKQEVWLPHPLPVILTSTLVIHVHMCVCCIFACTV